MLRGSSVNTLGEIRIQTINLISPFQIPALYRKSLTSRNFPRLLDFLQGTLGFPPGITCGLASLEEFGFFPY